MAGCYPESLPTILTSANDATGEDRMMTMVTANPLLSPSPEVPCVGSNRDPKPPIPNLCAYRESTQPKA